MTSPADKAILAKRKTAYPKGSTPLIKVKCVDGVYFNRVTLHEITNYTAYSGQGRKELPIAMWLKDGLVWLVSFDTGETIVLPANKCWQLVVKEPRPKGQPPSTPQAMQDPEESRSEDDEDH